jgi:hypothetical protein
MAQFISFPVPDIPCNVEVLTVGDWHDLEMLGRPSANWKLPTTTKRGREVSEVDKACAMSNINCAIGHAIYHASAVGKIPETRDQKRDLASIRRQAVELLELLGYDELGTILVPDEAGRRITGRMPWFQYLQSAIPRVPPPGAEASFDALGGHYFRGTRGPSAGGESNYPWWSAQIAALGWEIPGDNPLLVDIRKREVFERVLRSVPHVLALMAALAQSAHDNPITKQRKENYERAFLRSLFFALAQRYYNIFGEPPGSWLRGATPGISDGKRPGPPAFWAKRILILAHERLSAGMPQIDSERGTLERPLKVIRTAVAREESFFADRIRRGWRENVELMSGPNMKLSWMAD